MNTRLVILGLVTLVLLAGCTGASSTEMTLDDYSLGDASCSANNTGETTIEKQASGENTVLEIKGAVEVNGEYYKLTTPDLRETSGGEYELYVDSTRNSKRTEVCTAYIPYTTTINLGTDGDTSSKLTLYHNGNVAGKVIPKDMDEGIPVVVGA